VSDEINLECEAEDALKWVRSDTGITGEGCIDLQHPDFSTAAGSTPTDCTLVMQGQFGPFTCIDINNTAEAVVIIIGQ